MLRFVCLLAFICLCLSHVHATQSLKGKFSVLRVAAAHAADGEASEHPQEQNEPHAFVDEKQEEEGKMKRIADEEQEVKATAATIAQVVSKEVTLRDLLRETKRHNDLFEDSVRTQKLQNAMMLLHVNTHMQGVFDAPNDQNALGDMHFKVSFLAASKGAMKDIVNAFEKPNPEVDEPTLEIFRQYALEYMRFRAAEAVSLFLRQASYPVESFNDSAEYKRVKNISPNAAIWTLKAFELYLHTLSGMEPIIKRGFIYLI